MENNCAFEVNGTKVNLIKRKEDQNISIGKHKLYKLYHLYSIDEDENAKNETKSRKDQETKVKIQMKKEKLLKEMLSSHSFQKKQAEDERLPLPMAHQTYPSCRMLIDIGKNQKQSIEEIKQHLFTTTLKQPVAKFPNFAEIISYASEAYRDLYEQHLNSAKEIIMRLQPLSLEQKNVTEKPAESLKVVYWPK